MTTPRFDDITTLGVIGAGTIGASWAAYFLARGYQVIVWDPATGWADRLDDMIATAWPQLEELGVVVAGAAPPPRRPSGQGCAELPARRRARFAPPAPRKWSPALP